MTHPRLLALLLLPALLLPACATPPATPGATASPADSPVPIAHYQPIPAKGPRRLLSPHITPPSPSSSSVTLTATPDGTFTLPPASPDALHLLALTVHSPTTQPAAIILDAPSALRATLNGTTIALHEPPPNSTDPTHLEPDITLPQGRSLLLIALASPPSPASPTAFTLRLITPEGQPLPNLTYAPPAPNTPLVNQTNESTAIAADWLDHGDPATRYEPAIAFKGKVLRAAPAPSAFNIAPYTEALIEIEYEVLEPTLGTLQAGDKIKILHWALLSQKPTPAATLKPGDTQTLQAAETDKHPYLEAYPTTRLPPPTPPTSHIAIPNKNP